MADINKLKDKIKSTIYPNGKGAINASDHQAMLLDMADGMAETDTKLAELSAEVGKVSVVKVAGIAYSSSAIPIEIGEVYYDTLSSIYRKKVTASAFETHNLEQGAIYQRGVEWSILSNTTLGKISDNNLRKATPIADLERLKYENKSFKLGAQAFSANSTRLCSPTIVMSNGFRLKVKDGYAFYYYMYDDNGKVVAYNETNNVDLTLNYPFTTKMFIIFKHTDNSKITDINGAIELCENLYFPISEDGQDGNESIVAHFPDRTPWEPENVDEGYSNPTSGYGNDTKRADWSAADKYMYYDFLAHYYDQYLGEHEDGYKVTKRGLWQDTANTGHEVFEYDFCPKNYKYTIMLSAGLNADETQGIWGLATFMRALMGREETNMSLMKDIIRFKVIPILNPSGFDQDQLRYNYVNGVNPNYNFNFKDSWARHTASTSVKGEYPDSNYETKMLKQWVNDHAGIALLWVDLHTGRFGSAYPNKKILDIRFSSTSDYYAEFNSTDRPLIRAFYEAKGYVTSSDDIGAAVSVRDNLDYQKHRYALDVCGIVSAMPEMHLESTGYGSDGFTNNSPEGIKSYVLQLRQIIMYVVNKGK